MPVAKSFQNLKQWDEPFKENGRMYITVTTEKGNPKVVRWYTDAEYAKMYPENVKKKDSVFFKSQKIVLGFEKGYITIFQGVKPEHEDWFEHSICRWAKWWGWYVPSTYNVPNRLPEGVNPVRLYWDGMGSSEDRLENEELILKCVREVLMPKKKNGSVKQGNIGDRIERKLTVEKNERVENPNPRYHSPSFIHYMRDEKKNLYIWKTSVKNWESGKVVKIRGTVKEYDECNGENATILTRCIEVN